MLLRRKNKKPVPEARFDVKNFFIPKRYERNSFDTENVEVCALIPTFKPGFLTLRLVEDLVRWNPMVDVYVIDDCTPDGYKESDEIFSAISAVSERVTVLHTPENALKASALNFGLLHVFETRERNMPDIILTLDDDIVITPTTVVNLVVELMSHDKLGAVCSQCHVLNKNKNLLTRLQGLEYLGFNATRLADEGFYRGPLVMHGMLTAFRTKAIEDVGGFREKHLIEDYEMTARLKTRGWAVKSAVNSDAWTVVPEKFTKLWKQRTRWTYGGITVIDKVKYLPSVMQDLIGHGAFWATIITIDILIVSMFFRGGGSMSPEIPYWIIMLSLFQLAVSYLFQLWLMRLYREKDIYDWLIRVSIIPEFIYANILTFVLVGSYFFLFFNILTSSITRRSSLLTRHLLAAGVGLFRLFGYTKGWGTRTN